MGQPTKEQIEQFWRKLGFTQGKMGGWQYSDDPQPLPGREYIKDLPKIDPTSLFDYAIPKLQSEGYEIGITCYEQKGFRVHVVDAVYIDGKAGVCEDDDLSLALFGAINQVIK